MTAWRSEGSHCCWQERGWHVAWQAEAEEKLPALLRSLSAMASGARETRCGDGNSISGESDSGICKELLQNDQSASVLQGEELGLKLHIFVKIKIPDNTAQLVGISWKWRIRMQKCD